MKRALGRIQNTIFKNFQNQKNITLSLKEMRMSNNACVEFLTKLFINIFKILVDKTQNKHILDLNTF